MLKGKKVNLLLRFSVILAIVIGFTFLPVYTESQENDFVRCDACHVIEMEEFMRTEVHKLLECSDCHNISEFALDLYTHKATIESCTSCHDDIGSELNHDVHSPLQNASNETDVIRGSREICIICHTGVETDIEWYYYKNLTVDAVKINGTWNVHYSRSGEVYWNTTKNNTNYTE